MNLFTAIKKIPKRLRDINCVSFWWHEGPWFGPINRPTCITVFDPYIFIASVTSFGNPFYLYLGDKLTEPLKSHKYINNYSITPIIPKYFYPRYGIGTKKEFIIAYTLNFALDYKLYQDSILFKYTSSIIRYGTVLLSLSIPIINKEALPSSDPLITIPQKLLSFSEILKEVTPETVSLWWDKIKSEFGEYLLFDKKPSFLEKGLRLWDSVVSFNSLTIPISFFPLPPPFKKDSPKVGGYIYKIFNLFLPFKPPRHPRQSIFSFL